MNFAGDDTGIAHAYADDNAGIKGGPEVGSTGEGRTTGHGSGMLPFILALQEARLTCANAADLQVL